MSFESNSLFPFQPVSVKARRKDGGDDMADGDTNVSSITPATGLQPSEDERRKHQRLIVDVDEDTFSYADATKATSTLDLAEERDANRHYGTRIDLDDFVPSFVYDTSQASQSGSENVGVVLDPGVTESNTLGGDVDQPQRVLPTAEARVEITRPDEDSILQYKRQMDSSDVSTQDRSLLGSGEPQAVLTSTRGIQVAFGESMPLSDYDYATPTPRLARHAQQQRPTQTISFQRPPNLSPNPLSDTSPSPSGPQRRTVPPNTKLPQAQRDHRVRRQRTLVLIAFILCFVIITSVLTVVGMFLYCRLSTVECLWFPGSTTAFGAKQGQVAAIRTHIQNITAPRSPDPIALAWVLQQHGDDAVAAPDQWRQRYALVTLGHPLPSVSVCEWPGVLCSDTVEVVTHVDLRNHQIDGTLPIDLALLTDLIVLRLDGNNFSGSIPEEYFSSFLNLKVLSLASNSLSGSVSSAFDTFVGLEILDLSSNQLSGELPTSLGTLTQLATLAIQDNPRVSESIPTSYASLSLRSGYFYGTALTGTAPLRCHPDRVEIVADCFRIACPCCTHCCPIAQYGIQPYESCGSNSRSSFIVDYINHLRRPRAPLQYPLENAKSPTAEEEALAWIIDSDPLRVSDPFHLKQRYALAALRPLLPSWLSGSHECDWSGVGCEQSSVTEIRLEDTTLGSGSIPADIGMLTDLTMLHLFNNQVTGPIPSTIGLLLRLEYLDLSANLLTGTVPSVVGQLTELRELGWYYNRLTGTLPSEIGALTQLTSFSTSDNEITGTIPEYVLLWPIELGFFHNTRLTGNMPFCRGRFLSVLVADCASLLCQCCTACCEPGGWNGIPEYGVAEGWCR